MFLESHVGEKWYRGVVVKHADSQHRGYQFDSSTCHNKNAIGEEGHWKPPHEFHFPRNTQSPFSGFCYARNRVCNAVYVGDRPWWPIKSPTVKVRGKREAKRSGR